MEDVTRLLGSQLANTLISGSTWGLSPAAYKPDAMDGINEVLMLEHPEPVSWLRAGSDCSCPWQGPLSVQDPTGSLQNSDLVLVLGQPAGTWAPVQDPVRKV